MHCKQCGRNLDFPRRSDAKFCDGTCRKAYSRRGDNAKKAAKNIMRELQIIRVTIKRHPEYAKDLNEQLTRLKNEIVDILRLTDRSTIIEEAEKADLIGRFRSR